MKNDERHYFDGQVHPQKDPHKMQKVRPQLVPQAQQDLLKVRIPRFKDPQVRLD
jgi:hypothetical protein